MRDSYRLRVVGEREFDVAISQDRRGQRLSGIAILPNRSPRSELCFRVATSIETPVRRMHSAQDEDTGVDYTSERPLQVRSWRRQTGLGRLPTTGQERPARIRTGDPRL